MTFFWQDSVPAHVYFCHRTEQSNSFALPLDRKRISFTIYSLNTNYPFFVCLIYMENDDH